jgi:hypothetical protein
LHGLRNCYVRACVRALGACVHFTHAHVCTLLNIFSPKLVETFLGSQKRARHNLFLRARLRHRNVHGIIYFYVCACVCMLCAWMHAHARIRTLFEVFAHKFVKTSLCMCYILFTCALACAQYARTMRVRALHACARTARMCALTHYWTDSLQN